ncbi:transcription factor [Zalerion maritima]|uniref:Transcription factor n=1 Tax=Zalerion maritima TaxID=339359 RepID=A0AAD5RRI7_9PEZI|nr:transcription factor [Zalerion maritima]
MVASFQVTDPANEVVCPLRNQDSSTCRKRCIGEKRYRSMQEHIRRAHPEHYIPKLPATEESFLLMINTPPTDRSAQSQSQNTQGLSRDDPSVDHSRINNIQAYPHERHVYSRDASSAPGTPRGHDEYAPVGGNGPGPGPSSGMMLPAASAAAALAQLHTNHHSRIDADWDSEGVKPPSFFSSPSSLPQLISLPSPSSLIALKSTHANPSPPTPQDQWHSDTEGRRIPRSTIELPPIQHVKSEITSEPFPPLNSSNRNLTSILSNSPPGRSSTLPPIQRFGPRPRNKSITKRGAHRKKNSKGNTSEWVRRLQNEERLRPPNHERKALSAEPSADFGKRWEDLIDAAASATEDIDEDRTPVRCFHILESQFARKALDVS